MKVEKVSIHGSAVGAGTATIPEAADSNPDDGGHSHEKKAVRAGIFVIGGFGLSQAFRLGGNLVLTRLLFPEAFGIMAIANVFSTGLELLSDIGLSPAVIRSPRADEERFLNTAWTLQVIRGVLLWVAAAAVAVPLARFYGEPLLTSIVPVIALNSLIGGFRSTSSFTLQKDLKQGLVMTIELTKQLVALLVMIAIAYAYRTIWALVIGTIVGTVIKTVWTHYIPSPAKNRFTLDRSAVREILAFGKWVLFSTGVMFLAQQSDRILLGRLMPISLFGVYSIALGFAELPKQVMVRLASKVLFPLLSKYKHLDRSRMRGKIRQQRLVTVLPLTALVASLGVFGDLIMLFLYDARYEQAGWMFPLLAVGMWPLILYGTMDKSLYVIGKPQYVAYGNVAKFVYMLLVVPVAFRAMGPIGGVLAVAANDLPMYIVDNVALRRERLSLLGQDLMATLLLAALIVVGLVTRSAFGIGMPWDMATINNAL